MKLVPRSILTGVFAVALAGCGGGGGDSGAGGGNIKPDPDPVHGRCATTVNQCVAGAFGEIADTEAEHKWECRGSNGGNTAMCSLPKPPEVERGKHAVPGIGDIPLNQIKVTNEEMQKMFVLTEYIRRRHGEGVRHTACVSYTLQCEDPESFAGKTFNPDGSVTTHTGSAPYTSFTNLYEGSSDDEIVNRYGAFGWAREQVEAMGTAKIVVETIGPEAGLAAKHGASLPFLLVQSLGNRTTDDYDDSGFRMRISNHQNIQAAVDAHKVLYAAGWDRDADGNYIKHELSRACRGVDNGCLWAQFDFRSISRSGTSYSAPNVGAALASILAVFPDTTHQNLAKFAKACARRSGQGIEVLLREYGGVGVADFTCMGGVTQALANLPAGGRVNVDVNGQNVSLGERDVALSFTPTLAFSPNGENSVTLHGVTVPKKMEGLKFFLNMIPTGEEEMMLVGGVKRDNLFASASFGTEDDFFGFTGGHGSIQSARLTAGHESFFAHIARTRSGGGKFIREAGGQSLGLTVREEFALTENSNLEVLMQTEKFLGGSADIGSDEASFGRIRLHGSGWNHRLDLSSTTDVGENETVDISAGMYLPDSGRADATVRAQYRMAF